MVVDRAQAGEDERTGGKLGGQCGVAEEPGEVEGLALDEDRFDFVGPLEAEMPAVGRAGVSPLQEETYWEERFNTGGKSS